MFTPTPLVPPKWLIGGHAQTIYAKMRQSPSPDYRRYLLTDSHRADQFACDFIDSPNPNAPIVVLFHGLEGSSQSHYATELMKAVQEYGWHGVVVHFRTCGGVPSERIYHSGDTREIAHVLRFLAQKYTPIYAVGVSLGGNALAKYLGENGKNTPVQAAAVVSAPIDMHVAAHAFTHGLTKLFYTRYFLNTLLKKVNHDPKIPCKTMRDFDNLYTAPIHGYINADDYYTRCQCKPFLKQIQIPTLLINAQNDPFLPMHGLPTPNDVAPCVQIFQPQTGGHVGFVSGKGLGHLRWLPENLLAFFESQLAKSFCK